MGKSYLGERFKYDNRKLHTYFGSGYWSPTELNAAGVDTLFIPPGTVLHPDLADLEADGNLMFSWEDLNGRVLVVAP